MPARRRNTPRGGSPPPDGDRPDLAAVKDAARGRWRDVLAALAGIDPEHLDGRNRPCPWCGGRDRFNADRRTFAAEGRTHCNRCPGGGFHGDGFAAAMKSRGCGFGEALAAVADLLGVSRREERGPHGRRGRRVRYARPAPAPPRRAAGTPPPVWAERAAACERALAPARREKYARRLGVPADALAALGLGWCERLTCYTFPMRDAAGAVIGVRTRYLAGGRKAMFGSASGLFLPASWADDPPDRPPRLLVCEGETDAAAALAWGLPAAGRPGCRNGADLLVSLVGRVRPAEVAVLADDDPHGEGRAGAEALAAKLLPYVPVRVATPPAGIADARDWYRAGATAADVAARFDAAELRTIGVRSTRKGGRR